MDCNICNREMQLVWSYAGSQQEPHEAIFNCTCGQEWEEQGDGGSWTLEAETCESCGAEYAEGHIVKVQYIEDAGDEPITELMCYDCYMEMHEEYPDWESIKIID